MPPHPATRARDMAAVVILVASTCAGSAGAMDSTWVRLWRADLEIARTEFPKAHDNLFHTLSQADFDSTLSAMGRRLPGISHTAATMELARLLARVGDGHTRLTLPVREGAGFFQGHSRTEPPAVPGLVFGDLPIRLGIAQDTLFVRAVLERHGELLGAEVLRIGDRDAADAMARVRPYLHHDNEMQIQDLLPDYLVLPGVLAAAGVVPEGGSVPMQFRRMDGHIADITFEPLPDGVAPAWVEPQPPDGYLPRLDARVAEPFWFERIPGSSTVYFQCNEVADGEQETLAAFCDRLAAYLGANRIDRLILDLRANHGGNNFLNRSLLHMLIRSDRVNQPGRLFVLVGRSTFSAAMMLAVDLQQHTQTLFVGEPTGASPSGYGDSRKVRLPNTGLTARISTLYWQYAGPNDGRAWIAPHIAAPPSRAAWWAGRDPGIDAVLQRGAWAPRENEQALLANQDWQGNGTIDDETHAMVLRCGDPAGTSVARLDLPGFGAEDLELTALERSRAGIGFSLPVSNGVLRFEARPEGARLYGTASLHGLHAPFVLWPATAGGDEKSGHQPE